MMEMSDMLTFQEIVHVLRTIKQYADKGKPQTGFVSISKIVVVTEL